MIGERLRAARLAASMSQQSLADAAGVSKMAVSKYERNLDMPGSAILLCLSEALGIELEFLFRPTTVALSPGTFRCRKGGDLTAKQRKAIYARLQEWLERYLAAEEIVGRRTYFELPQSVNPCASSLSDVERIACELRQAWDLGTDAINDLGEVLEDRGVKVESVSAHDDFDAVLCFVSESEPVIAANKERPGDRQRFNLAHELGHLVLRPTRRLNPEKLAQRFAGAFLAPESSVKAELGERRRHIDLLELHLLKHKYGLSMQGWIHRAAEVGVISNRSAKRFLDQFKEREWYVTEPGDQYPAKESERLRRLVTRALAEDLITESRAAELLGMSVAEFVESQPQQHEDLPVGVRG